MPTTVPRLKKPLVLNPQDRDFIVGMTGSGKTAFARYLDRTWVRAGWPLLIIDIDQGWTLNTPGFALKPEESTVEMPWRIPDGRWEPRAPVQIYEPSIPGWQDPRLIELAQFCLARGNMIIHIDELYGVVDTQHMPVDVMKLWTSGRKKNIHIIALSQRPANIPKVVKNQSQHFYMFRLIDPDDLESMRHFIPDNRVLKPLPKFYYWIYNDGEDAPTLAAPLPASEIKEVQHGPVVLAKG